MEGVTLPSLNGSDCSICSMGKECKVPQSSATLLFHPMFVRLLAGLRAKPQHPLSMHDETELPAAAITTPHIILLERKNDGSLKKGSVPCDRFSQRKEETKGSAKRTISESRE